MSQMPVETEIKLTASEPKDLGSLRSALAEAGADVGPATPRAVRDYYLDTEDWRLYRAGVACRLRVADDGALLTLKSLTPVFHGLASRTELEEKLPSAPESLAGPVPGQKLAAWLQPLLQGAPVAVKLALEKQGDVYRASLPDGLEVKVNAEVVRVSAAGRDGQFAEAEMELVKGDPAGLQALAAKLGPRLKLEPGALSKFERGLKALGVKPPTTEGGDGLRVRPEDRLVDAAYRVLQAHFNRFMWHEPGTRLGLDPEYLHDMRVATRRLRAALRVFADALPPRHVNWAQKELRHVGAALGKVRDLDVHLLRLGQEMKFILPELRPALDRYRQDMLDQREKARGAMVRVLDSKRFARFVERFGRFLRQGPPKRPTQPAAHESVLAAAPRRIRGRLKKVLQEGRAVEANSPERVLHGLRILCKRLRYACEFFSDLYGPPAGKLARRVVALQDLLGVHQDAVVAQQAVSRHALKVPARRASDRLLVLALGQLSARHSERARQARDEFTRAWKKFDRKKVRTPLLKRMRKSLRGA